MSSGARRNGQRKIGSVAIKMVLCLETEAGLRDGRATRLYKPLLSTIHIAIFDVKITSLVSTLQGQTLKLDKTG